MKKQDLVKAIAADLDMKQAAVESVLDSLARLAFDEIARGEDVLLPGIGKLTLKTRAARTGRNPATGEAMQIAEKRVPHFSAAKAIKDAAAA